MATLQELQTALVNADKAGDTAAATILARELKNQQLLGSTQLPSSMLPHASIDPESPDALARTGRGFMDIGQGTKQRYLQIADPAAAGQYTHDVTQEQQRYERGAGPGFDAMRFVGRTAAVAPFTAALAAASPVTGLGGAMIVGAEQGGYQGLADFTPEGKSVVPQIIAGAGSGAAAPVGGAVIGNLGARAAQTGQGLVRRLTTSPDDIVAALKPALAQGGVRWDDLGAGVKQNLFDQARRQMSIDGDLSPDALVRKLQMDQVLGPNAGPTRAQVTRDPAQWSFERNQQKLPGDLGLPLTERYQDQLQRLQDRLREIISGTGGKSQNDYQAGLSATQAVQQKMSDSGKAVDDLYGAWRNAGKGGTEVKAQPIADTVGRVMDEFGAENIPPAVQSRLKDFGLLDGKQTKLLTIDEAEKLRKLISNNDPGNGPASAVSGMLKRAVDGAVMDTDTPEIRMLQDARAAARGRFAVPDSAPAVAAAADTENAPDQFFKRFVLNGDVRDLQGLKATLNTTTMGAKVPPGFLADPANAASGQLAPASAQAWKDLKGQTLEYAMSKATGAGEGSFSGKAFRKALNEVGDERLNVLFEPDELKQLRLLNDVAYNTTAEPPLAAVNHSNTAGTAVQYMQQAGSAIPSIVEKATGIPFIGKIGAGLWNAGNEVAKDAELKKRVALALTGDVSDPQTLIAQRSALAHLIADRVSPLATAGGTAALLGLTQ